MKFSLEKSIKVLERTPVVLNELLQGLSDEWTMNNEGENTFSPYDVVGHLIHGEKTDWIARLNIVLSDGPEKTFTPYDRFAQYEESRGKALSQLLVEFKVLRKKNLEELKSKNITPADYQRTGIHPSFGPVTLAQLLSTWAVHDLSHLAQIARVMCKQYKTEVGPWLNYLPILSK